MPFVHEITSHMPLLGLIAFFFLLLIRFKTFDPFGANFEDSGWALFSYQWARVLFLPYLMWIIVGAGSLTFKYLSKEKSEWKLNLLEEVSVKFFLGASVLTIFLFLLGYLNLYYFSVATTVSVACFVGSFTLVADISKRILSAFKIFLFSPDSRSLITLKYFLLTINFLVILFLLISRVIYPGETSPDCWEHYIPYQAQVIANHGIWPNDVWYHFFYSKGVGLVFLSILLTDILAYQLVTFCFILVSAVMLYIWIKKITKSEHWGLLATFLYLACYPFTNVEQATFHSHHIVAGIFLVSIAWLWTIVPTTHSSTSTWKWVVSLVCAAFVVYIPHFSAFSIPFLMAITFVSFLLGRKYLAKSGFIICLITGLTLIAILVSNYFISGMFIDSPLTFMTKFANREVLSQWTSPYIFNFLIEGTGGSSGLFRDGKLFTNYFWEPMLRLDLLKSLFFYNGRLFLIPLGLIGFILQKRKNARFDFYDFLPLFLILALVVAAILRMPTQSIFRNLWFMTFFMCVIGIVLWWNVIELFPKKLHYLIFWIVLFLAVAHSAQDIYGRGTNHSHNPDHPATADRAQSYLRFALGQLSFREALQNGDRMWDNGVALKKYLGIDKKILLFNDGHPEVTGIMVYGSGFLKEPSRTSLFGKWHLVAFEEPAIAEKTLRQIDVNYFAVDLDQILFSCVAFSPLFRPEGIGSYFDLAWANRNVYVLTWKGNGQPLPKLFIDQWSHKYSLALSENPTTNWDARFRSICNNVAQIYQSNKNNKGPIQRPENLEKVLGWE